MRKQGEKEMKINRSRPVSIIMAWALTLVMVLTIAPISAFAEIAPLSVSAWNGITNENAADGDSIDISSATDGAGGGTLTVPVDATVTITGTATGLTPEQYYTGFTINLPADSKVIWAASLSGETTSNSPGQAPPLVTITGGGTFEMSQSGAKIENTNTAKLGSLKTDGNVTISGGMLKSAVSTLYSTGANVQVNISGGTITSGRSAIDAIGANTQISISGDATISGACEGGYSVIFTTGENAKVTVSDSATVSGVSIDGRAIIHSTGASSTITLNGGTVEDTGAGSAISSAGGGNVQITGGEVIAGSGFGILQNSGTLTVDGGAISSVSNYAIRGSGGSTVIVNNGTISSNIGVAVYTICGNGFNNTLTVNGGRITGGSDAISLNASYDGSGNSVTVNIKGGEVVSTGSYAIRGEASALHLYHINISGGKVIAGNGYAVYNNGAAGSTTKVLGGAVFAYGTDTSAVISGTNHTYTAPTTDGVVIAWDEAQGTTNYTGGETTDLVKAPAGATVQ
jgi:hypothetical protein